MFYRVTDGNDNDFFTDNKKLAVKVVMENDNPFTTFEELDSRLQPKKGHCVKTYADFCMYFY